MEVDANGRVIIDGIEYQRVSQVNASPDWYKGITPWKVNDHVRSQTDEWKRKYVRKARSYNTPVMVVELNALRELLKQDMETPFLEDLETGRMVI